MISVTNIAPTAQQVSISENVSQESNKANFLYPPTPGPLPGTISCHPIIYDPCKWRAQYDADLLKQADALAQDAFQKVSPFNSNVTWADRLQAQQEMQEAEQIRNEVRPDLDPCQQHTLDQINNEEQQAVSEATTNTGGNIFTQIFKDFDELAKMADGTDKSQALENSLQGIPEPSSISFPFGPIVPLNQIS
jgi:hypothetical protein